MDNKKTSKFLLKFLYVGTIVTSITYIGWRIFFTIPFAYGTIATIAGILLILAETTGMLEALQHYYGMNKTKVPEKPDIPISMYPDVDVFIASYNEDAKLLYKTINGCKNMEYPNKHKVHIYLCDDSNRPEMKLLCEKLKIGYITREEHIDAKAGNLNNAMKFSNSPYIVTFDADMIPLHNFLMDIVPYMFLPNFIQEDGTWRERTLEEMDEDYKIGFIQSPQSFYNSDLFQYNLYSERRVPNEQDYFYRDVQLARNNTNSPIYGGSNTIISRAALEEINGFYTGVITEDFATGISIQAKGYTTYAISDILAIGLAPTDLKSLIKQRERWARGCIQTLKKVNVLTKRGLHIGQRISYLSSLNYWYTPYRRLMYILSPILFTVFHIMVVDCTLPQILLFWLPQYLFYNTTLRKLSGNIRNTRWSNVYDTIMFPSLLMPVLKETIGIKQQKFVVTKKHKEDDDRSYQIKQAFPHMILFIFSLLGIVLCLYESFRMNSIAYIVIIFWLIVNLFTLGMSIFFMLGRKVFRSDERFFIEEGSVIYCKNRVLCAKTIDLSDHGLSLAFDFPDYIDPEEHIKIELLSSRYPCTIYAKLVQIVQTASYWKYGFIITEYEEKTKDAYFHLLYDRIPSLPKHMDESSSLFDDLACNIHRRIEKTHDWSRKLPRIPLHQKVLLDTGEDVDILNFNYEYVLIHMKEEKDMVHISIGDGIYMHAKNVSSKMEHTGKHQYLYRITNMDELTENEAFYRRVKVWILNYDNYKARNTTKKNAEQILFNENDYL